MKRIRRKTLIDHVCREERKFIPEDKKTFTALDLLEMEGFPDNLKLTLVLYDFDLIPKEVCNEFACRCAERALGNIKDPDPRSVAVIKAKRAWLRGEISDAELAAAWASARAAASAAAKDASRAAASDAARAAARDAAWDAAWDAASAAAWAAARDAAWDAAWDAERAWQVEELKKLVREAEA